MRIKVCGMKYPENMKDIGKLQPDYLGLIFYEKSPRYFNTELPEFPDNIKLTGVFVGHSLDEILYSIEHFGLEAVQLHGKESPSFCRELRAASQDVEVIKVFSVGESFEFDQLKPYESVCDYFLFDTRGKDPGGNGIRFDWSLLREYPFEKPFFLSGGIGLEDVKDIEEFANSEIGKKCHALDVNSRLETEPGFKDVDKTGELIDKVKRIIT